jgi:hypothetical protein
MYTESDGKKRRAMRDDRVQPDASAADNIETTRMKSRDE